MTKDYKVLIENLPSILGEVDPSLYKALVRRSVEYQRWVVIAESASHTCDARVKQYRAQADGEFRELSTLVGQINEGFKSSGRQLRMPTQPEDLGVFVLQLTGALFRDRSR